MHILSAFYLLRNPCKTLRCTASNILVYTYLDTIFFIIRFQKFSDDVVLYFTLLKLMYYTYF